MIYKSYNYRKTKFFISAPNIHYLPNDNGIEIAFIGGSNVGKSSALNALTLQKKLAYTSKKPGRTQLINVFEVENNIRLIDLPGYGYAQAPIFVKMQWQKALNEYLHKRKSLKGLIILMDIRHPLKYMDIKIIQWSTRIHIPTCILLNKADKLKNYEQNCQIKKVRHKLKNISKKIEIEIFSSFMKIGINILEHKLNNWINKN
ncbi:ribosome biogenesis GTP-binding protein YihA/YsxC [Arsenophonus symbiont of Ornithomya chloropus]|uniref:ribosome biogenesis GTP-binding protein YihA/YsxC n=1 Tax=Arsenophonus symbiont of Ornithomya chloropus TaxID=634121 RepID=UPI0032B2610F